MFGREFVKAETCEAQIQEGDISHETRTYSNGGRISRLHLRNKIRYLPDLIAFDIGSDGTFELAYSAGGEFVRVLFDPTAEKDWSDRKKQTLII